MNANRSSDLVFAKIMAIVFSLVILLTACGAPLVAQPTAEPTQATDASLTKTLTETPTEVVPTRGQGGTLTLLYFQAPTIVNPHLSVGDKDLAASRITYEPLANFDKNGNMLPILAAEIPTIDNGELASNGTSVTWKLKQDIKWADGEPFTADDVLFTYEYVINPEVKTTSAAAYAEIDRVEVLDDYTVKITFKKPTTSWFTPFVSQLGMIIPRHIFEAYNGANAIDAPENLKAMGTGPYYVSEFRNEDVLIIGGNAVTTNKIIYEINPYYRDPNKPFFSKVEVSGGGDLDTAVEAGKEGLVDYVWNIAISEERLVEVEAAGKGVAVVVPSSFVERIMFNFSDPNKETTDGERSSEQFPHPFLSDLAVRQAIAMAINREVIAIPYGRGGTFTTNILVDPPIYASSHNKYNYDPQKAAEILDNAGWVDANGDGIREKDGVELRLVFQTSIQSLRQKTQEQVKKDLGTIGISVELKQIDSSIFFGHPQDTTDTRRQFYADLQEFAYSNKSPDPTAYMAGWACNQVAQKENEWSLPNWSRYCNPEFDKLFQQAANELDQNKRAELFVQMNELLIQDVAVIPIVALTTPVIVSKDLKGYEFTAWDSDIWNIQDWYK